MSFSDFSVVFMQVLDILQPMATLKWYMEETRTLTPMACCIRYVYALGFLMLSSYHSHSCVCCYSVD